MTTIICRPSLSDTPSFGARADWFLCGLAPTRPTALLFEISLGVQRKKQEKLWAVAAAAAEKLFFLNFFFALLLRSRVCYDDFTANPSSLRVLRGVEDILFLLTTFV